MFLYISNPYKFSYTWIAFIPLTVGLLLNFMLLFLPTIKNKLNLQRINTILTLDILLQLPCAGIAFYLLFGHGIENGELPALYFIIATTILGLTGAITAKIIQHHKNN
ncbi:MAG: hypothetical protein IJA62_03185 [Ruminococcus sp.]|nr:hypothetical protein [Ruminococcus sp.]